MLAFITVILSNKVAILTIIGFLIEIVGRRVPTKKNLSWIDMVLKTALFVIENFGDQLDKLIPNKKAPVNTPAGVEKKGVFKFLKKKKKL